MYRWWRIWREINVFFKVRISHHLWHVYWLSLVEENPEIEQNFIHRSDSVSRKILLRSNLQIVPLHSGHECRGKRP
jgi:hypothetical protein